MGGREKGNLKSKEKLPSWKISLEIPGDAHSCLLRLCMPVAAIPFFYAFIQCGTLHFSVDEFISAGET